MKSRGADATVCVPSLRLCDRRTQGILLALLVLDQGVSIYAIIADTACPGARLVTTRFEAPQDLIVRLTERVTSRDCVDGASTEFIAMVHTRDGVLVDSIHGYAGALRVINPR